MKRFELLRLLHAKASDSFEAPLSRVERELCRELDATRVELLDEQGHPIEGQIPFGKAIWRANTISVDYSTGVEAHSSKDNDADSGKPFEVGRVAGETAPRREIPQGTPTFNEEFFIREFDRRERDRGIVLAAFVVNDLCPRLGFDAAAAKRIVRSLEAQGVIRTEKRPNPKNADRPATAIVLNREHPAVRRVLAEPSSSAGSAISPAPKRKLSDFRPIRVPGPPVSEDIVRERR